MLALATPASIPRLPLAIATATLLLVVEVVLVGMTWVDPGTYYGLIPASLLVVALFGNFVAGVAEARRVQADRRREAELSAELARLMLGAADLQTALDGAGRLLAETLKLEFASFELGEVPGDEHRRAMPLRNGTAVLGTLVVPADLPEATQQRLRQRVVPSVGALLAAARDREVTDNELAKRRDQLALLAEQQKALRRVATLVACGFDPQEVFSAVADEMALCLRVDTAEVLRYEPDGTATVVGCHSKTSGSYFSLGERLTLDGDSVAVRVLRTLRSARIDSYRNVAGPVAARVLERGLESAVGAPIVVDGRVWGLAVVSSSVPEPLPADAEERIGDFAELVATAIANAAAREQLQASRDNLGVLATQQAALRRVATLVAGGLAASDVFAAVAEELARCLRVDNAGLFRYEDDGSVIVVASYSNPGRPTIPIAERFTLEGANVPETVLRTGRAARMDDYAHASGTFPTRMREIGARSRVGAPIMVDERVWGMALVSWSRPEPLPPDTEDRTAEFAELVGTAIAAATARADLIASRARIVAAGDNARRRLERNLHDGAQQRLISLGLKVRLATDLAPAELEVLRSELNEVVAGLTDVSTELQEISRGIHPAILSQGGLGSAIKSLARRSAVPVSLEVAIEGRLRESVEVAVYYMVAEALTNAAKHAQASEVRVHAETRDGNLLLSISDDGVGGANSGKGSGLVGLKDRAEALGGRMHVTSAPGCGTSLDIVIPLEGNGSDL